MRPAAITVLASVIVACGAAPTPAEPASNANPPPTLPARIREAVAARPVSMDLWIGSDVLGSDSEVDSETRARIACFTRTLETWSRESDGRLALRTHTVGADTSRDEAAAAGVMPHLQFITSDRIGHSFLELLVHTPGRPDVFLSLLDEPAVLERGLVRAIREAAGLPTRIGVVAGTAVTPPAPPPGVELVTIDRGAPIPDDVAALYVVAPVPPFSADEAAWLDGVVRAGRRVVVLDRAVELSDLTATISATAIRSNGLEAWLASNGVTVEPTLVGSTACNQVPHRVEGGALVTVDYPPAVVPAETAFFEDDLAAPALLFASPVRAAGATVVWTARDAWTFGAPPIDLHIRPTAEWAPPAERADIPLGVVVSLGAGELVVVGSSSLFDEAFSTGDATALEPALRLAFAGAPDEPSTLTACP